MEDFRIYFDRRKRYVAVYLHDVTPQTFERRGGGRWAFYQPFCGRTKSGLFGDLHFIASRVRADVVGHELIHVLADYLRDKETDINVYNEERIATLFDGWTRHFWREYERLF